MGRFSTECAIVLLCFTGVALGWQQNNMSPTSWSGVIINSGCTADEAFAESDKCYKRLGSDVRLSLYDDTTRQIYELDAQDQAARYFGDSVTVEGTLQGGAIRGAVIDKLTSIGLDAGQKAPALSALDQFGREHNLDSLKGPKGTVLLFFRSADW